MTLERHVATGDPGDVRLVECPFCEADLRDGVPARHLEACAAFYRAFDVDPPPWASEHGEHAERQRSPASG